MFASARARRHAGRSTTNANQVRAVTVDAAGNAYIASQTGAGVSLQRILAGGTTIASTRALGAGTNPGVVAGPGNSVVVAYTNGTAVYATVQTY